MEGALAALVAQAQSDNPELRFYVGNALLRLHDEHAIPLLIDRIRDKDWGTWGRDLCNFGRDANSAEPKLLELAQHATWPSDAREAVGTLGCVGSAKALPILVSRLGAPDWEMNVVAAEAIGKIGIADQLAISALTKIAASHWSARVRKAASDALAKLTGAHPLAQLPSATSQSNVETIVIGGAPGPINHGLPWCDDTGRYSIDGKNWFMVHWVEAKLESVPPNFPRPEILQRIGLQAFQRVADGWLVGSDGFEDEGILAYVSNSGDVVELDEGNASINGIVKSRGHYYAFGFEILKSGHAGVLFEFRKSSDGHWQAVRVLALPSPPWWHAFAPTGELLLGDGPNDYAVMNDEVVPLKCEKTFKEDFFKQHPENYYDLFDPLQEDLNRR